MIYVHIPNELKKFETDIRDLCLAFFTLQKITYIFEDAEGANFRSPYSCEPDDIVVKDYFSGSSDGDRLKVKSDLKRQLYDYLSELTGKKLLWGTLTGIRPVTIVTKILEEGGWYHSIENGGSHSSPVRGESLLVQSDIEINKYLREEYYISDEKADELLRIAKKEIEILNREEVKNYKDSYSIYVGVPFCKSTCLYCSFASYNIGKFGKYVDKYLDTLERDFSSRVKDITKGSHSSRIQYGSHSSPVQEGSHSSPVLEEGSHSIEKLTPLTLYIGGGTPTSLNENQFESLLTIIDKYVDRSRCIEYTVEAGRPDTISEEKLLSMKRHGVTRISINPQSFNQKTLDLIGRKHTVNDVKEKFRLARDMGFDNINMDIILGLPNEHLFDVLKTLNEIRKLNPDSLTVHSLALKRAARLNFELEEWTKNYYLAGVGKRGLAELAPTAGVGKRGVAMVEGKREIDKMFKWSERLAKFLHLNPYYLYRQKNIAGNLENVGYAKDGKECIYNIMMMSERHSVYGFGTGTTKEVFYENDGKRIESEEGYKSVIDYCERVGK